MNQMVAEADFQQQLPCPCELPMPVSCKICPTEHAEVLHRVQTALVYLNLVNIAIFRKAQLLDVNQWDKAPQLMYTIDSYVWYQQLKPLSMASPEEKLYHHDEFKQWSTQRYTSYKSGTGWQVECCMSSGVETRRNWGPRLSSGGNRSIEFQNSGLEEDYQLDVPIFCFFSSLLFSSLLFSSLLFSVLHYFVGSRPGINGIGKAFTTSGSQSMGGGVSPLVSPCAGSAERSPLSCANR